MNAEPRDFFALLKCETPQSEHKLINHIVASRTEWYDAERWRHALGLEIARSKTDFLGEAMVGEATPDEFETLLLAGCVPSVGNVMTAIDIEDASADAVDTSYFQLLFFSTPLPVGSKVLGLLVLRAGSDEPAPAAMERMRLLLESGYASQNFADDDDETPRRLSASAHPTVTALFAAYYKPPRLEFAFCPMCGALPGVCAHGIV